MYANYRKLDTLGGLARSSDKSNLLSLGGGIHSNIKLENDWGGGGHK